MYNAIDKFGRKKSKSLSSLHGRPGIGFKLDSSGNYDMQGKRLTNIGNPSSGGDSVPLEFFNQHLSEMRESLNNMKIRIKDYPQITQKVLMMAPKVNEAIEKMGTMSKEIDEIMSEYNNKIQGFAERLLKLEVEVAFGKGKVFTQ